MREVICATNDFVQLAQSLALLINEQFRVTDDVDKENVPDLQSQLPFLFVRDVYYLLGPICSLPASSCSKPGLLRIGSQTGSILSCWMETVKPLFVRDHRSHRDRWSLTYLPLAGATAG